MTTVKKLTRTFYDRDSLIVAKDLLGKILVHESPQGTTSGKIVEAEAYRGLLDKAAHSYHGVPTARTRIMFGPGGHAYIYLIYGMYYCLNIVTGAAGIPQAVLLRALEPLAGIDLMQERRKSAKIINLCSGPGKLCQAMGITKEHYGADLLGSRLYLTEGEQMEECRIAATPRVNIDYAEEAVPYPWRFIVKGSRYLSVKT